MEICVTRFTNITYNENRKWLNENNEGVCCIYGTPIKIKDTILPDTTILVILEKLRIALIVYVVAVVVAL